MTDFGPVNADAAPASCRRAGSRLLGPRHQQIERQAQVMRRRSANGARQLDNAEFRFQTPGSEAPRAMRFTAIPPE